MLNNMGYTEYFTRYYRNNTGYLGDIDSNFDNLTQKRKNKKFFPTFHTSCVYTKKKKCFCKFGSNKFDSSLSNFINDLYNGNIDIDVSGEKISIKKNNEQELKDKKIKIENSLISEEIKVTNFKNMYAYNNRINDNILLYQDYKEVEKKINEDKKICEKCGISLYGDNFHKGWKNENGDYVLLCSSCSKKYFAGANDLKYENNPRDETQSTNYTHYNSNNTNNVIPPFKTENHKFQVIHSQNSNKQNEYFSTNISQQKINNDACSKCGKSGKKHDFVQCSNCHKYYHPYCINQAMNLKLVTRFNSWYCPDCERCSKCGNQDNNINNPLIKCVTCFRSFHHNCYQFHNINGKNYCIDCICCKNCQKILNPMSPINSNDMQMMIKGFRTCEDCWKNYKLKKYCPICLKVYKNENDSLKVYCNKCLNWYHIECEGISLEQAEEIKKKKNSFTCSVCKMY